MKELVEFKLLVDRQERTGMNGMGKYDGRNNAISPLPYHAAVRDHLKQAEPAIWQWFASNRVRKEQADAIRFDLLKSTYRIERDTQPETYEVTDQVAQALKLDVPITLYQSQSGERWNASIACLPDEAHIVFQGPLLTKLSTPELQALLAHELGHLLLYHHWDGDLLVVQQVLAALTHDRFADTPHFASARLFDLYTEVYCDRVAECVLGSPLDVISMLVKVSTGLPKVDPRSYLKQAKEIFEKGSIKTEGISHPETYIRAFVLHLWNGKRAKCEARVAELIEGPWSLEQMDLLGQRYTQQITKRLIDAMLAPKWMQTTVVLAHARLFFDQYAPAVVEVEANSSLRSEIENSDDSLKDYYCYVLLDFVASDRDLEDAPLAHAIQLASVIGLENRFGAIVTKELRLRKKQYENIFNQRQQILKSVMPAEATV